MTDATPTPICTPDQIRDFWFSDRMEPFWFAASDAIDAEITDRFATTYQAARDGRLDAWMATPLDALALIITLDQFPRNMFRGTSRSFESDHLALAKSRAAVDLGFADQIPFEARPFLYLPFMHSEDLTAQDRSVALYQALGKEDNLRFAHAHRDVIAQFGRFPHRNAMLDRTNTPEETEFLKTHKGF